MVSTSVAEVRFFMRRIYLASARKYAIVDDEDYQKCLGYKWHLSVKGYVETTTGYNGKRVKIHQHITDFKFACIDHKNHNPLDNRRSNLRPCTKAENNRNSRPWAGKKYKGTSKNYKGWRAMITVNYERKYLGTFSSEEEAAMVYNKFALKHFGEFAYLNPIQGRKN